MQNGSIAEETACSFWLGKTPLTFEDEQAKSVVAVPSPRSRAGCCLYYELNRNKPDLKWCDSLQVSRNGGFQDTFDLE